MSSPIRNTFSSRSISSRSASRSAARNSFSGIATPPALAGHLPSKWGGEQLPLAGVEVAIELVDGGVGALVREADGLLDLRLDALLEPLDLVGVDHAGLQQPLLEPDDRVAPQPVLLLLVRPVLVGVDDGVALEAVVDRLDEARL